MRVSYDPQDIQDMARLVAQELMPLLLAEIREAASRQPPPVVRSEPTSVAPIVSSTVVSKRGLRELTGLSPSTVSRLEAQGLFPRRVTLSPGRVGWRRDEILAWRDTRVAA